MRIVQKTKTLMTSELSVELDWKEIQRLLDQISQIQTQKSAGTFGVNLTFSPETNGVTATESRDIRAHTTAG
jgi:hypothetical protein